MSDKRRYRDWLELNESNCCGILELSGIQNWGDDDCMSDEFYENNLPGEALAACVVECYGYQNVWEKKKYVYKFNPEGLIQCLHPFFYFSDNTQEQEYAKPIVSYLRKHKLGKVWSSDQRYNPTGSLGLKMYVWQPDAAALGKWYEKTILPKYQEDEK
jgi:hypothetical protein